MKSTEKQKAGERLAGLVRRFRKLQEAAGGGSELPAFLTRNKAAAREWRACRREWSLFRGELMEAFEEKAFDRDARSFCRLVKAFDWFTIDEVNAELVPFWCRFSFDKEHRAKFEALPAEVETPEELAGALGEVRKLWKWV
jgi:hypothetical protein